MEAPEQKPKEELVNVLEKSEKFQGHSTIIPVVAHDRPEAMAPCTTASEI